MSSPTVFGESYPGVNVEFETIPFGDYIQKLTLQIGGGNPPDLGWMLEGAAPTFIESNVLHDIGPTLTGHDRLWPWTTSPTRLWGCGTKTKPSTACPSPPRRSWSSITPTCFAAAGLDNPAELAAQGNWTWDALREAAGQLADAGNGQYGFESMDGQGYDSRVWDTLVPLVRAYGGDVWQGDQCNPGRTRGSARGRAVSRDDLRRPVSGAAG